MKLTIRQAINANCKECIYDPAEKGNWVEQVEACNITKCAFYEHRKLTAKTKLIQRENYLASLPEAEREIELKKTEEKRAKLLNSLNTVSLGS